MSGKREKVVVAMSGGVDSSVAACLLVEQGYDVVGLFMRTGVKEPEQATQDGPTVKSVPQGDASRDDAGNARDDTKDTPDAATISLPVVGDSSDNGQQSNPPAREHRGCCSASDAADARFVAGMLGIPFYVLDFEKDFDQLIDYFADEYAAGRTPNPCVVCNDRLKFGRLVEYADAVGAKFVATGHYARIGVSTGSPAGSQCHTREEPLAQRDPMSQGDTDRDQSAPIDQSTPGDLSDASDGGGAPLLMRSVDTKKDQTYVLFGIDRSLLGRLLFPIGHLEKSEVRRIAERYDFPNQNKPDSVEICFVPDRDYARVVRERRPDAFKEGDVIDESGEVIGRHNGIGHYTIGQRRGLGIAAGKPIYVTELNVPNNVVTMGGVDALLADTLIADRASFLVDPPGDCFCANVKIRYLHQAAPATVTLLPDNQIRIVFDEPQKAITPGQAVVLYDDDVVIGGAWIHRAEQIETTHGTGQLAESGQAK